MGKADLHIHTTYSDGAPSVRAVLDAVAARGDLTAIAITDHDTIAGAVVARRLAASGGYPFDVVVGEEITTRDGHLVGLFLTAPVPPGLSAAATVAAVHAQGGLVFAAHPFFRDHPRRGRRTMDGAGRLLGTLALDAVEVTNSTPGLAWANYRARRFARRRRLVGLGASDAHIIAAIGKAYTCFPGHNAADLRHALRAGAVTPGTARYTAADLLAYLHFWRSYPRGGWHAGRGHGRCRSPGWG